MTREAISEQMKKAIDAATAQSDGLPTHVYLALTYSIDREMADSAAESVGAWVREMTHDDDGCGIMLGVR